MDSDALRRFVQGQRLAAERARSTRAERGPLPPAEAVAKALELLELVPDLAASPRPASELAQIEQVRQNWMRVKAPWLPG